jgi:hypothetical protein
VTVVAATLAVAGASSCSSTPSPSPSASSRPPAAASPPARPAGATYPSSIAALGHSGLTGYNSDPADQTRDALENSWATGDNPAVNSLYTRILAKNPAIKGHAYNVAKDGSTVNDLPRQITEMLALDPRPDLVVIQSVDNDMRCDGSDPQNIQPFGRQLTDAITSIATASPNTRFLLVSSPWGTTQDYTEAVKDDPDVRPNITGDGPCDSYDDAGLLHPERMAYSEQILHTYHQQLQGACSTFPTCRYDDGAMHQMPLDITDISPDGNHLSIHGHARAAAIEWAVLF